MNNSLLFSIIKQGFLISTKKMIYEQEHNMLYNMNNALLFSLSNQFPTTQKEVSQLNSSMMPKNLNII